MTCAPLFLERHDPDRNMARFYALSVEPTLFGEWRLICRWGRIRRPGSARNGQIQAFTFADEQMAMAALAHRQHQKQRRGYCQIG